MNSTVSRRLTVKEAAEYLGLSPATLNMERTTGKLNIPYLKIGRRVLYDTAQLDQWLATCRRRSTSDPGPAAEALANG